MNGLSDSVAWPSRDPEWVAQVVLMGLINLIPIVGMMALLGWMLAALDNLRENRPVLPQAGFSYIRRGVDLFVVYLVYGLVLVLAWLVILAIGLGILALPGGRGTVLGVAVLLVGYAAVAIAALALLAFSPPIILATDRGGIAGGLNVPNLVAMATADVNETLRVGLFALVAFLIGGMGALVCLVGQVFTVPYGYAALARVVQHYEQTAGVTYVAAAGL
ncbi:MAG TPA: DUF4013 domain-containing protein [Candidatus Dormibacteraeota bacterium]|nr:DUF4013 domain-containing protein [Candidatus Dormibacteraeota bacterium]